MGVGDRVSNMADRMQEGARNVTTSALLLLLKLFSGAVLGLTIGLVIRELLQNGFLTLIFVTLTCIFGFLKISAKWSWGQTLIFDLICILVGMLLRMYIVVAP